MPHFRDLRQLAQHLEDAATSQLRLSIIEAQAQLGSKAVSPVDTSRLRSSWFASEGAPSDKVAPEGSTTPQTDANALKVVMGRDYHLTNSLPYARPVALGVDLPPSWGGESRVVSKAPTWFIDWRNNDLPKILEAAGRRIKAERDL